MIVKLPHPSGKGIDGHWVYAETSPRRVRVAFGGETIADSREVLLLREAGSLPAFYFPPKNVKMEWLRPTDHRDRCPYKDEAI
jgi:uncharacterized protein (DUF427 family)